MILGLEIIYVYPEEIEPAIWKQIQVKVSGYENPTPSVNELLIYTVTKTSKRQIH